MHLWLFPLRERRGVLQVPWGYLERGTLLLQERSLLLPGQQHGSRWRDCEPRVLRLRLLRLRPQHLLQVQERHRRLQPRRLSLRCRRWHEHLPLPMQHGNLERGQLLHLPGVLRRVLPLGVLRQQLEEALEVRDLPLREV